MAVAAGATVPDVADEHSGEYRDELPAEYRSMTSDRRSGELLPEHLVAQLGVEETSGNGGGR